MLPGWRGLTQGKSLSGAARQLAEFLERIDAESCPAFEAFVEGAAEFFHSPELKVGEGVFVGGDLIAGEFEEMDDAEVHLADGIRIVVEEGDYPVGVFAGEDEFLFDFPGHAGHVGGFSEMVFAGVDGIDVSADAHGPLGVEPGFAA